MLLATDPDREGEAISWHLAYILGLDEHAQDRVTFNEITKNAVKESLKHPREIDMGLVDEVYSVGDFSYQSMQAIGYKEFAPYKPEYIGGHYVLSEQQIAEIKDKIKQYTRNYAKRQLTWFRKYDFVKWFDVNDQDGAIEYIQNQIYNTICRENATKQA